MKLTDHIHSYIHDWLKGKVIISCIGIKLFLIFLGGENPLSLYDTEKYEIIYDEKWKAFDCVRPEFCFMHFKFVIGHSGNENQQHVEAVFNGLPDGFKVWKTRIIPLTAHADIGFGAELSRERKNGKLGLLSLSSLVSCQLQHISLKASINLKTFIFSPGRHHRSGLTCPYGLKT